MARYDSSLDRSAAGEIVAAWVVAVAFLAALSALPTIDVTDHADNGYRGNSPAVADTVAHDAKAL